MGWEEMNVVFLRAILRDRAELAAENLDEKKVTKKRCQEEFLDHVMSRVADCPAVAEPESPLRLTRTSATTILINGGGGNRTPVPRRFQECLYVCSRSFESRVLGRQPTGFPIPQPDCCFAAMRSGITRRLAHWCRCVS